jgi:hypothetical protein
MDRKEIIAILKDSITVKVEVDRTDDVVSFNVDILIDGEVISSEYDCEYFPE